MHLTFKIRIKMKKWQWASNVDWMEEGKYDYLSLDGEPSEERE